MSGSPLTSRRKSARVTRTHPAVGGGPAADQDLAVVEQVELAGELALAEHGEHVRRAVLIALVDLDLAFEHEKEVDAALPALEQQRPRRNPLLDAVGPAAAPPSPALSRGKVCASRA